MNQILITALITLFAVTNAQARTAKTEAECEQALTSQAAIPWIDYAMSDLEGLFFTYLGKMRELGDTGTPRHSLSVKELLSMKAEVLNSVGDLLPAVAYSPMSEHKRSAMISSLFQIVDTLGIPGRIYGFKINDEGIPVLPISKQGKTVTASTVKDLIPEKDPIGFLPIGSSKRDLEDHVKRSIGFKNHEVRVDAPPNRALGQIRRQLNKEHKALMIIDGEQGEVHILPLAILTIMGAEHDDKKYEIQYHPEIREWIVKVENLNNPTGRIGF